MTTSKIENKLSYLNNTKQQIRTAIENQGINVDDSSTFREYVGYINSMSTGGGLEVGDIGISPFGIDESLNKRRYLNGQVIQQSDFPVFTTKLKKFILLYPQIATTEEDWQARKTKSPLGQVSKFVVDNTAGTIRLPRIVRLAGCIDMSTIGSEQVYDISIRRLVACKKPTSEDKRWWNWYSDGWLEQGGMFLNTGTNASWTSITVTFEKPFINTMYTVLELTGHSANTDVGCINAKTTTTAQFSHVYNSSGNANWVAFGYADVPTLDDYQEVNDTFISFPYYIQVALSSTENVEVENNITLATPYCMLEHKYFDLPVDNACWLRSNGQWNSVTVYEQQYNYLLGLTTESLVGTKKFNGICCGNYSVGADGIGTSTTSGWNLCRPYIKFLPSTKTWRIQTKVKKTNATYWAHIVSTGPTNIEGSYGIHLDIRTDNKVYLFLSSNGTWNITTGDGFASTKTVELDTWYWVRLEFTGTHYIVSLSTDGETFEPWIDITNSATITPTIYNWLVFGLNTYSMNNIYNGQHDFNETWYELDNERVWNAMTTTYPQGVKLATQPYIDEDFVVNTATQEFRLPLKTKERYIVERKEPTNDSPDWYTLWSDGWLEQGGRVYNWANVTYEIWMPKAFKDTNYHVSRVPGPSGNTAYTDGTGSSYDSSAVALTTRSFTISTYNAEGLAWQGWNACGYAPIPTDTRFLYYYVGNAQQNLTSVNVGRVTDALTTKVSKNEMPAYIIKAGQIGTYGYVLYNNGLCQQWDITTSASASPVYINNVTITLKIPYKDATSYSIQLSGSNIGDSYAPGVSSRKPDSFVVNRFNTCLAHPSSWYAIGFIDPSIIGTLELD